jgi:hypothetical protein
MRREGNPQCAQDDEQGFVANRGGGDDQAILGFEKRIYSKFSDMPPISPGFQDADSKLTFLNSDDQAGHRDVVVDLSK